MGKPPLYFQTGEVPQTYQADSSHEPPPRRNDHTFLAGLANAVATLALVYFAVDNYSHRIRLEKTAEELASINLKTLQLQEAQYVAARKKRDFQILQERKEMAKRSMRMGLHIALLRKQLEDHGVEPATIEEALKQFEQLVRVDNLIKNVLSQNLWIDDGSELKQYLPDYQEYDKKKADK